MNKLKFDKQVTAISALVEGSSIRSVERMTGIHRDTIMRLMVRVGNACGELLDESMRDLDCRRLEVDEIWTFVGKKARSVSKTDNPGEVGDFWAWVAIDPETKLVPSHLVGKRTRDAAVAFMRDLAPRMRNRVQVSSDRLQAYVDAVEEGFGTAVDYGQIVKFYESERFGPGRYSPPKVTGTEKRVVYGNPDARFISTSIVERNNLNMRTFMRRFTRLTNGFSKKRENLEAAVALHFAHYNLVRRHGTLRMTPAMAAGVMPDFWRVEDLVALTV